jgi:hypothetical protein
MSLIPAVRNLPMKQGADFEEIFSILLDGQPIKLTGYSFSGDCREEKNQTSDVLFSFTFELIEDDYSVRVTVPREDFDNVPLGPTIDNRKSQFWYDYFQTNPSGDRAKIQEGRVSIDPAVTELA